MNETEHYTPPQSVPTSLRGTKQKKGRKREALCISPLQIPSYQSHFKNFYSTTKLTRIMETNVPNILYMESSPASPRKDTGHRNSHLRHSGTHPQMAESRPAHSHLSPARRRASPSLSPLSPAARRARWQLPPLPGQPQPPDPSPRREAPATREGK